jgi:hypothetical protein
MTTPRVEPSAGRPAAEGKAQTPVTPLVAAAYIGSLTGIWAEALFRLVFTWFPNVPNSYNLWPNTAGGRDGDIAAMWVSMLVLVALAFLGARYLLRGRTSVGLLRTWTIILIVSAIVAPLIGEIGTPIGI